MYKLIFTKKVENDFIEITNFIAQDNPIYAIKTIDLLLIFPLVWKEIDEILREIVEPNYKYKIVYQINKNYIIILSVIKYKNSWE